MDICVAQSVQGCGCQLGSAPIVTTYDYASALEWDRAFYDVLDPSARYQRCARDVRRVVLARLSDVDQREGGRTFKKIVKAIGGDILCHLVCLLFMLLRLCSRK